MVDYYAVLTRTLSGFASPQKDLREKLYARARLTIKKQLEARTPAPDESVVMQEMQRLEETIIQIEAEYESKTATQTTTPPIEEPTEPSPQETLQEPVQEPITETSQQPIKEVLPEPPQEPIQQPPQENELATPEQQEPPDPIDDILQKLDKAQQPTPEPTSEPIIEPEIEQPNLDSPLEQLEPIEPIEPTLDTPAAMNELDNNNETISQTEPIFDEQEIKTPHENLQKQTDKKSHKTSQWLLYSLLLIVLFGFAYIAWQMIGNNDEPLPENTTQNQTSENEETLPEPKAVKTIPIKPKIQTQTPSTNTNEDIGETIQTQPTEIIAKSNAILYESGSDGKVDQALKGTIEWSATAQPLETSGPSRKKIIHARVEIPPRNMIIFINITNHNYRQLPASHLIDLTFVLPKEASIRAVRNINQFILKETEADVGKVLNATATKIDENIFLLALNNLQQAQQDNETLLLNRNWIDIPIQYQNGARALISLEKGEAGQKVFQEVFDSWKTTEGQTNDESTSSGG